jgi:ribosomal 50S subunit-recycling heat shock protein
MRLDKYLKASRLIKRRTLANEACDAGKVEVNGKPARASCEVKCSDLLRISFGSRVIEAEVTSVKELPGKENAQFMYTLKQSDVNNLR